LRTLFGMFPNVKCCVSNHTARPFRRALKYGIPRDYLRSYGEFLGAPDGWEWADKWEIDGVLYEHGEGVSGAQAHLTAATQNMQSTVIGHIHTGAGVAYYANPKHLIFGMNVGWLGDKDAYSAAYGKSFRKKPIVSLGLVVRGVPRVVPMPLNSRGRWTGEVLG